MRLLVFDIDGTLLLSGGAGTRALDAAFREVCGIDDAMRGVTCGGLTDSLIVEQVLASRVPGRLGEPGLEERILSTYLGCMAVELESAPAFRTMPHARECLESLASRPDVALAIGTGNVEAGAALKLRKAGLDRFFPVGGFGSDDRRRAGLLVQAARRARAHYRRPFLPEDVWVVGDTPLDVAGAREAGYVPVGVGAHAWDAAALLAAGAVHAVDDLSGLTGLLDS